MGSGQSNAKFLKNTLGKNMTIDSNFEILSRSLKPINLFSPQRVKVNHPEKESEVEIVKFPHLGNGFEVYYNTGTSLT